VCEGRTISTVTILAMVTLGKMTDEYRADHALSLGMVSFLSRCSPSGKKRVLFIWALEENVIMSARTAGIETAKACIRDPSGLN